MLKKTQLQTIYILLVQRKRKYRLDARNSFLLFLKTVGLQVPAQYEYIREFSTFSVCLSSKNLSLC
jgi:hypothetical protein